MLQRAATGHYGSSGHVNVLSDYKKLGSKIQKTYSHHHHVIDILNKFCQNHIPPALLVMFPNLKIGSF